MVRRVDVGPQPGIAALDAEVGGVVNEEPHHHPFQMHGLCFNCSRRAACRRRAWAERTPRASGRDRPCASPCATKHVDVPLPDPRTCRAEHDERSHGGARTLSARDRRHGPSSSGAMQLSVQRSAAQSCRCRSSEASSPQPIAHSSCVCSPSPTQSQVHVHAASDRQASSGSQQLVLRHNLARRVVGDHDARVRRAGVAGVALGSRDGRVYRAARAARATARHRAGLTVTGRCRNIRGVADRGVGRIIDAAGLGSADRPVDSARTACDQHRSQANRPPSHGASPPCGSHSAITRPRSGEP